MEPGRPRVAPGRTRDWGGQLKDRIAIELDLRRALDLLHLLDSDGACLKMHCSPEYRARIDMTIEPVVEALSRALDTILEDCGCCGCKHPRGFSGDCRDDWNRF